MSEQTEDVIREHEYDGIREYDNPTPGWWKFIFFATFFFSIGYYAFYHVSPVPRSIASNYDVAVAEDLKLRFAEIGNLKADKQTILRFMSEPEWLTVGASVFAAQCVSCHGPDGEGLVGPNLTDNQYKNVRTLTDIHRVISEGAANGAMPGWKSRLHPNELVLLSSYVASLRGKDLPSPRGAPEGEEIPPWPPGPPDSSDADDEATDSTESPEGA